MAQLTRAPSFVVEPHRKELRETFVKKAPVAGGEGFFVETVDTRRFKGPHHKVSFVVDGDDRDGGAGFAFDAYAASAP